MRPKHLRWKASSPDREDLVEQEHVRVEEGGDREAEAHRHPGRVRAHRPVDRVLELGERDDLVEARADLGPTEPLDRTVEEHVLAPGEVGVEPRAELEERADAPFGAHLPGRRLDDSRDHTQERRLARAVTADEPDRLAARDVERDVVERPDVLGAGAAALDEEVLQRSRLASMDAKAPRDAFYPDLTRRHREV